MGISDRRNLLIPNHPSLSLRKQCELMGINRSSVYYQPKPVDKYNLLLMKLIDEAYTERPTRGVVKMVKYLADRNHHVNHKRVRRLMRQMGLMAVYPKKINLSKSYPGHKKYPYLLKGLDVIMPNQVWCADITYIRLYAGFVYLIAVMDWYSRYVLSWKLSNTLDTGFCIEALEDAILYHGKPDIFNTDQGVQFTSEAFTGILLANNIEISMDTRGRAFDNIFIERLWRTVKYEEVYLRDYESLRDAKINLEKFFRYYNFERHHQGLNYRKPAEVYFNNLTNKPANLWTSPSEQPVPFGTCG